MQLLSRVVSSARLLGRAVISAVGAFAQRFLGGGRTQNHVENLPFHLRRHIRYRPTARKNHRSQEPRNWLGKQGYCQWKEGGGARECYRRRMGGFHAIRREAKLQAKIAANLRDEDCAL
jgi:hypothetical protein